MRRYAERDLAFFEREEILTSTCFHLDLAKLQAIFYSA
jgi:hypothetical protein